MRLLLASFALVSLLGVRDARAEDGCTNPKTSYDRTYCTCKLFIESDNELNEVYKELKGQLPKDLASKLTSVQKEWITYRNSKCESGGTIAVDCNFDVNKARTEYLRDRLRECKTGHCQDEKIATRSW